MKYSWFVALEQPDLTVFTTPAQFSDSAYLERFGFLPSERDDALNPNGLPIGFAIEQQFQEPYSKPTADDDPSLPVFDKGPYAVVGLTCAACHTGQINYQGRGIRIEGGPAMVNLRLFQDALSRALFYTDLFPTRFARFARRVLQDEYKDAEKLSELRTELHSAIKQGLAEAKYADKHNLYPLSGGFGRTDALTLIANRAFADFNNQDNLAVANAVSFPAIWDAPWEDWVQYNASIRLPMVRNIGEVLGVGGLVNINPARGRRWLSTANVENLHWMEAQIAGPRPLAGLQSPKWPKDILGDFDPVKMASGKQLYETHCASCHVTIETLNASLHQSPPSDEFWHVPDPETAAKYPGQGVFIRPRIFNLDRIGTIRRKP